MKPLPNNLDDLIRVIGRLVSVEFRDHAKGATVGTLRCNAVGWLHDVNGIELTLKVWVVHDDAHSEGNEEFITLVRSAIIDIQVAE